jgi:NosR/NirI family transcriptional regulator, nitrous oxide reductase regulator
MRAALRVLAAALVCMLFHSAAYAQTTPVAPQENIAQAAPTLADLDNLIEDDAARVPSLAARDVIDIIALLGFLLLAMVSFWKKSRVLKLATLVASVLYMGFMKGNLVSLVHIFGLMELSFPIFKYNISWYLLIVFTLLSTGLWGRLYCGRVCAFGALTQLMDQIIPAKYRFELPRRFEKRAIYAKYVILAAALAYFALTKDKLIYKYIEPFWMFTLSGTTVTWTLLGLLLLTTVFIKNFYCRYLCSVGSALGILSNLSVFRIKRWKQCNTCKLCEKACEWGAIQGPKISVAECVRCDDCEILYSDDKKCVHWLMLKKNSRKLMAAKAT